MFIIKIVLIQQYKLWHLEVLENRNLALKGDTSCVCGQYEYKLLSFSKNCIVCPKIDLNVLENKTTIAKLPLS